jgi:hypothetical protein
MDYRRPVEVVIPGVQGRVLGVLSRAGTDLTMRGVADLAGVSPQQASVVIGRLVELGVVERRDVPPASLVRLVADNLAAQAVLAIANFRRSAIKRLTELASAIRPQPASLVVFGSFARGEADSESDIDVLAVRPLGLGDDDDGWTDALWAWTGAATKALGNPVNVMEAAAEEIPRLLRRRGPSVWTDIVRDGIILVGSPLEELARVA